MYKQMQNVLSVFLLSTLITLFIGTMPVSADDNSENDDAKKVKPGIEVLLDEHLDWLEDKRVGLITNPTGVTSDLESSIDVLYNHPEVNLTALYGPEHGIRGNREAGEHVDSYTDEKTGLPVYSLYGDTWKPTKEMLEDVDILLFDIQDIDSNVYTYIYTLGFAMEAAAEQDKEIIVLDRPNPNGGTKVEGPVRDEETVSFMGRFLLPVRHGMTVGELAKMWNDEHSLGANLQVAKMDGWQRNMSFEDTDLPWVMTSPNIPTEDSAHLYAGTELLDDTNLSEGLGTTRPFELVGAPWIDAEQLAEHMNNLDLSGVTFRSAHFTPTSGAYKGELISGVQVHINDPLKINQVELGLHLLDAMRDQNPEKFEMDNNYQGLIGDSKASEMIRNDEPVEDIIASWENELDNWIRNVRNPNLLYPSSQGEPIDLEDIEDTVEKFEDSEDIQEDAIEKLDMHLEAVEEFEEQGSDDKVIEHMKGFKTLIDSQKNKDLLSSEAHQTLKQMTDTFLNNYSSGNNDQEGVLGILPHDLVASPGEDRDLTVLGYDEDGEKLDISADEVDWQVDDENIGYVKNGTFHAENEGKTVISAKYEDYNASREVDVSETLVEGIRYAPHADYTRVVFDLSRTNDHYDLNRDKGHLKVSIPYAEIGGNLNKDGGTVDIENSPVLSSIDYSQKKGTFVANLNLKLDDLEYKDPEYSSRLVLDLQH